MTNRLKSLNKLLPFVAIGTVADCQSILEPTNRLLVRAGIKILQDNPKNFIGLSKLLEYSGLSEKIRQNYKLNSQDLAFTLSPILNASGRMNHARLSISVLLHSEKKIAEELAKNLIQTNNDRKKMVKDILSEVEILAKKQFDNGQKLLWLEGDWSKGIVGLLASRLVNQYNLPVAVISTDEDNKISASLRAPEGFHLPLAMQKCSEFLIKFGGHPAAAGFTTDDVNNLPKIYAIMSEEIHKQSQNLTQINQNYSNNFSEEIPEILQPLTKEKDLIWLKPDEIKESFLNEIWQMDPFGQDLKMPILIFPCNRFGLNWFGENKKYLKIKLDTQTITVFQLDLGIQNELKNLDISLQNRKQTLWIMAKTVQNTWNGSTKNELIAEKVWIAKKFNFLYP